MLGSDIIIAINEQPVRTNGQFGKAFHRLKAEQSMDLTIVRDGGFSTRTLTLGERLSPSTSAQRPTLGGPPLVLQGMGLCHFKLGVEGAPSLGGGYLNPGRQSSIFC